jgi:hypothetical protein
MEAVYLTMKHFLTQIKDQAVLVRSDNTPRFEKDSELPDCSKTILLVVFLSD